MYNTTSSSPSDGRGSSSSLGKNYSSYNNKYTKREERYGDNGSNSRSSRTDERDNRSPKRKSRWDVGEGTRHAAAEQKRKSRSRSPTNNKYPDSKKKAPNNWSDSSSDEEDDRKRRVRNDGDRRPNHRNNDHQVSVASNSYSNNGDFKIGERTGIGLDLGYHHHQLPPPPVGQVGLFSSSSNISETKDIKNLNNNNYNNNNCYLNGSGSTPKTAAAPGIQIKMIQPIVKPASKAASALKPKIASVFNVDDDDDEEEMPPECKMRMKNIGRETPTSAGPNSFGKTKLGFCNSIQIKERKLEEEMLCRK